MFSMGSISSHISHISLSAWLCFYLISFFFRLARCVLLDGCVRQRLFVHLRIKSQINRRRKKLAIEMSNTTNSKSLKNGSIVSLFDLNSATFKLLKCIHTQSRIKTETNIRISNECEKKWQRETYNMLPGSKVNARRVALCCGDEMNQRKIYMHKNA